MTATATSESLALLESRLARGAAEVLAATRAAAFDPTLAAGGQVGAVLCAVVGGELTLAVAAEEGPPLAGPLLPGVARVLLPYLGGPGDVVAVADPRLGLGPQEVAMARGAYAGGRLAGVAASLTLHDALAPTFVMTPLRLVAAGEGDPALLALAAANGRRPGALRGDLLAQAAGLAPGVAALERLTSAGGLAEGVARLARAAEAAARAALRGRPADEPPAAPEAAATVAEGDDLPAPRLRLTLVPDGAGGVGLDFGGSDLYQPGAPALAAPRAAGLARLAVARALPEVPLNAGLLAAVDVRLPARSVLAPALPDDAGPLAAPAGDVCLAQRVVDLVHRALARLVPARALAGDGDGGTLVLEAPDRPARPGWRCRLPLGGGGGASVGADGLPNVPPAIGVAPTPSIEALEAAYPIRIVRYALREGGAGAGRYRGGAGVEIEVELLGAEAAAEVRALWLGPAGVPPVGILGGGRGAPGEASAAPARIAVRTGCGGGYGNPYERAIRLVVDDLAAGLLTPEEAKRAYGVALRPGSLAVDDQRTYRIRNFVFTALAIDDL